MIIALKVNVNSKGVESNSALAPDYFMFKAIEALSMSTEHSNLSAANLLRNSYPEIVGRVAQLIRPLHIKTH